ncbi:hypothetical protein PMAYCL1PPCAC_16572, partial [Pristionchus mayeri]
HTDSPVPSKKPLIRRVSMSADSSPVDPALLSCQPRFESRYSGSRRMTIAVPTHGTCDVHDDQHLRPTRHQSRRATVPSGADELKGVRNSIPWMHTVIVVRRNTRKKAFIMLSLNLILWLPYFAHAILSSFVFLDHSQFQFACALV